ncbi:hypothetical protein GCM10022381_28410 [Leifsonia kafniensis]|uniref:Uncharacterized protein n=1 Tax=Leifsonia kafniensis TaxID=475957 RepID=A0ABP7KS99_9MICO
MPAVGPVGQVTGLDRRVPTGSTTELVTRVWGAAARVGASQRGGTRPAPRPFDQHLEIGSRGFDKLDRRNETSSTNGT